MKVSYDNDYGQTYVFEVVDKIPEGYRILTAEVVFNHDIRVTPWKNWMYEQYRDKNNL